MWTQSCLPASVSTMESDFVLHAITSLQDLLTLTSHIIRKTAHVCEYAVFGGLLTKTVRSFREDRTGAIPWIAAIGLAVCITDETIQLFVPGRSGQISDLWFDMAGMLVGMLVAGRIERRHGRKTKQKTEPAIKQEIEQEIE